MKDLTKLEQLNDAIEVFERSIEYLKSQVKAWHESNHDWHKMPFFDLAETEERIASDEQRLEVLKSQFNIALETLKY